MKRVLAGISMMLIMVMPAFADMHEDQMSIQEDEMTMREKEVTNEQVLEGRMDNEEAKIEHTEEVMGDDTKTEIGTMDQKAKDEEVIMSDDMHQMRKDMDEQRRRDHLDHKF